MLRKTYTFGVDEIYFRHSAFGSTVASTFIVTLLRLGFTTPGNNDMTCTLLTTLTCFTSYCKKTIDLYSMLMYKVAFSLLSGIIQSANPNLIEKHKVSIVGNFW